MQLSERGYRKIKAYEGYCKALPDGRCEAYREKINGKLDVWTIGYGCTRGVEAGMIWTEAEADAKLRQEISIHEARVTKLSTVDLNQNEFDALVSFDFNCGGLTDDDGKPTGVLRALNSGDRRATVTEMKRWNKFNKKDCDALTARRADEAALFLKPTEPAQPSTMPQSATPSAAPVSPVTAAAAASTVVASASQVPVPSIPDVSVLNTLQTTASTVTDFATFLITNPLQTVVVIFVCVGLMYGPKLIGGAQP